MIEYSIVQTEEELKGILSLLESNLAINVPDEIEDKEGFLTVAYSFADLKQMHDIEPGIIAQVNKQVIAYVLALNPVNKTDFPTLKPLFDLFDIIMYAGKPVRSYNYLIIGQACIDKNYRGKGVFKKIYAAYIDRFKNKYDFAISEIATRNKRSMNAHSRIGFIPVHQYTGPDGVEWTVVILDWKKL
ncbi:MAG: GNAT family N-acetyltransferase [Saprospiraceae bacterium]|nr:GNAT family N-acetyltransferase [Saprospiraceae bacterium]